jgi:hypothetical protein
MTTRYYSTPSYLKPFNAEEERRKLVISNIQYGNSAYDKELAEQRQTERETAYKNKELKSKIATPSYLQDVSNGKKQLNLGTLIKSKAPNWQKALLSPLAAFGSVGQWVNGDLQNNDGTVTGSKFLGRTLDQARSAYTGGAVVRDTVNTPMDTGSKLGNIGADLLGMGAGFGVHNPMLGASQGNALNQAIGQPVERGLVRGATKLGLTGTASKIGIAGIKTGAEFGGLNGMTSLANGDNAKEMLENVGEGFASGALFGGGGRALGELKPKIGNLLAPKRVKNNAINDAFINKFGEATPKDIKFGEYRTIKEPKAKVTVEPTLNAPLKGKFTVKNTALEKATNEYEEAIQAIQNRFGTHKLIPEEVPLIKSELGIDLPKLVSNLETARTDASKIGERQRLGVIAGVNKIPPKLQPPSLKASTSIPKKVSDMVSTNMDEFKMPNEFTKIKEYKAPVDTNGNSLLDPKIVSSSKDKATFKQIKNKLYTSTVDNNNPTAKFSKVAKDDTFTLATNSASHKDISNNIMDTALVNKDGIKIGKSLKEVLKDMPNDVPMADKASFENYLMDKHNIARAREGKPVKPNYNSEQSAATVSETERLHPEWSAKAKEITKWISDFMDEWGVKAGTLDEGLYNANKKMYPDYIPTNREYSSLELLTKGNGASGYANQTIPIKRATGSARDIIDPRESIAEMVERTVKSAKNNEVFQSMVNSLRNNPEELKGFAEIVGEPNGNAANVVRVLEKGKPTYVQINDEDLLKNVLNLNKTNAGKFERGLRATMNVPKALITHKNPLFGIKNVARDLPTAYVYGSESNPIKFGANYLKAYYDIATNSKVYQQFKGVGAESGNFFDSGDSAKSINKLLRTDNWFQKGLKAIPNGIESFNSITESAPRLSEFKTVLKKTGDIQKALFAAKDVTTNFGRNGNFTKHVDSGVMYLNAGVQGLDKLARQVKNKPLQTLGKGLASITAPALVINAINKNNPHYQELDNRIKDTYYHIPNPKDGGETFIKIPKSRELGVIFGSLEERALRMFKGDKKAFKGFANTVATNFSPANPIDNNLLAPAFINLPRNKDFADRPIVPQNMIQDKRSPNLQYDEKSSELSKWFGNAVKDLPLPDAMKSPKQLDYIMRSYLGGIAQVGLPATTKSLDKTKTPGQKAIDVIKSQFISDPTYSNQAVSDFYDNLDKVTSTATDKTIIGKLPSKLLTPEEAIKNRFNKASKEISDLNKLIKQATSDEEIRNYKKQIIGIATQMNRMVE